MSKIINAYFYLVNGYLLKKWNSEVDYLKHE